MSQMILRFLECQLSIESARLKEQRRLSELYPEMCWQVDVTEAVITDIKKQMLQAQIDLED